MNLTIDSLAARRIDYAKFFQFNPWIFIDQFFRKNFPGIMRWIHWLKIKNPPEADLIMIYEFLLDLEGLLNLVYIIQLFPCKQFHFLLNYFSFGRNKFLFNPF